MFFKTTFPVKYVLLVAREYDVFYLQGTFHVNVMHVIPPDLLYHW